MPGALGCSCGDGDGDVPNLEEIAHEVVCCVMDSQEALCYTAPLEVNRINRPARESKRATRAEAVGNRESVKHCADVLGVEFGRACRQIHSSAAFRHRSRLIAARARRAQRIKSYKRQCAVVQEAVNRDKGAFEEPPVGVESVRRAITGVQVRSGASKVQVGLSDHSVEVGDGRRIKSGIREVRESWWSTAVGWAREEEVSPRRGRDVRDGPRQGLALVIFAFVIRKRRQPQSRAEQESSPAAVPAAPRMRLRRVSQFS